MSFTFSAPRIPVPEPSTFPVNMTYDPSPETLKKMLEREQEADVPLVVDQSQDAAPHSSTP